MRRRTLIGLIAIVLLVASALMMWWPPMMDYPQFLATCCRVGVLMAAWWLAYPDLMRMPAWIWAAIPVFIIVVARWPRLIWIAIPAMVVLAFLKPRIDARKRGE